MRGNLQIEGDQIGRFHITRPDGRIAHDGCRLEVYEDGTVLINGSMLASGFPSLTITSGTFDGGGGFALKTKDGATIPVTKELFMKYDAAMRQR